MDKVAAVLYFLVVVLEVILIFNLLIVVHELGHFLAARWRGLVVEQFAVWFGKPLWKRTYKGVVYSLGSIPFGGFVKLPQMAPMESIEGESETPKEQLPAVSPLDKIIVAFAGPLFSMGLAFVFAVVVWAVQRPVSQAEASKTIGFVVADGPAAKARSDAGEAVVGMQPGDRILEVDGHPVTRFGGMNGSVVWYVARSEGDSIPFKIQRGDRQITFYPTPDSSGENAGWFHRRPLREVLIEPAYMSLVAKVVPGSPADKAGLQKGDEITAVNGQTIYNVSAIEFAELASFNKGLELTVKRGAETLQKTLPAIPFKLGAVTDDAPAEKQGGLKKGDVILAVNDVPPTSLADFKATMAAHADQPVELKFSRNGAEPQRVTVTPRIPKDQDKAIIGVLPDFEADGIGWMEGGKMTLVSEKPTDQIASGVMSIVNTIGAVLAPKSGIKLQHLGGPLMIANTYYRLLTSENGWRLALWFSVVLNVNLALLNLLPVPLFDGGHIVMGLIELIRRKPLNVRILEMVQVTCFVVVVGYMLYISSYDFVDLISGGRSRRNIEFRPPAASPAPSPNN